MGKRRLCKKAEIEEFGKIVKFQESVQLKKSEYYILGMIYFSTKVNFSKHCVILPEYWHLQMLEQSIESLLRNKAT